MTQNIDIKKLLSLLKVDQLRDLAYRHNVQTQIKAPSQMLKAELIKSLSDHYLFLSGTNFIPVRAKDLSIPREQIPEKYRPEDKTKYKFLPAYIEQLKNEGFTDEQIKEKQRKHNEAFSTIQNPSKIDTNTSKSREIEKRGQKYTTDKNLAEAIKKRETRQAKQKESREKLKKETKKEVPKKDDKKTIIRTQLNDIVKRVKKLKTMTGKSQQDKDFYEKLNDDFRDVMKLIKETKNLTDSEIKEISEAKGIFSRYMNDDKIMAKFEY